MIFEKNAKTGELAFSKSFLLMVSVCYFWKSYDVIRGFFLNGNVAFLLLFLIDLLIVYPMVKKNSICLRNFQKKSIFFITRNCFKVIKKTKKKISAEIFFKTLIGRSLDFLKNYALRFHLGISRLFGHTVYCKYYIKNKHFFLSRRYLL
jgi:hypothetical protein